MNYKSSALTWLVMLMLAAVLYGDVPHASDPRGKIEKITGEGEYVWDMNQQKQSRLAAEAKEKGEKFNLSGVTWTVKGEGQDWIFTRTMQMEDKTGSKVKAERFWISIIKADGVWVTRTKYRYNEDGTEVGETHKGGKYTARCRITEEKIVLLLTRKKQGHIFRITNEGGLMRVIHITMPGLIDWSMDYKKQ